MKPKVLIYHCWDYDVARIAEIISTGMDELGVRPRGRFDKFTGTIEFDGQRPERTTVEVQIDAASLNSRTIRTDLGSLYRQ